MKQKASAIDSEGIERTNLEIQPLNRNEREQYINYLYHFLLRRSPTAQEVESYLETELNELKLFQSFIESPEFTQQQSLEVTERQEYIRSLYQILLRRDPTHEDLNQYAGNCESYLSLLRSFTNSEEYSVVQTSTYLDLKTYLGCSTHIMGESNPIDPSVFLRWHKDIVIALLRNSNSQPSNVKNDVLQSFPSTITASNPPLVTIIMSLYKGGKYIRSFLENITHQTLFNQCHLLIIDANSPESEGEIISPYLTRFPDNIIYHRLEDTIGIYEAWNFAIENSCSPYITNANVDDCHRQDAIELKLKALIDNPEADVVYSDVYYSFIENLPFDIIEEAGLRTYLPVADLGNLLQFNSPHNAPLWRRSLHDKIGLFDCNYKSAGDLDFWLRAALANCQFVKLQEVVSAYYHNPQGLSTRSDRTAVHEILQIKKRYSLLLQA
ncbi:MAG: glycosyltransferase [Synechocystis sp.]|nr:glycosyltransferase [Synechocystis sp.]